MAQITKLLVFVQLTVIKPKKQKRIQKQKQHENLYNNDEILV